MSIFLELLRCFLCCEDEHDYDYQTSHENSFPESHPYNQLPWPRTHFPWAWFGWWKLPIQKFCWSNPHQLNLNQHCFLLIQFSPSKCPTSLGKIQQSSYVDSCSTSPKPPTSSSKPLKSTFVNPSSTYGKPPTSSSNLLHSTSANTSSSSLKPQHLHPTHSSLFLVHPLTPWSLYVDHLGFFLNNLHPWTLQM